MSESMSQAECDAFKNVYAECRNFVRLADREVPDIPSMEIIYDSIEALKMAVDRAATFIPQVESNPELKEVPDAVRG